MNQVLVRIRQSFFSRTKRLISPQKPRTALHSASTVGTDRYILVTVFTVPYIFDISMMATATAMAMAGSASRVTFSALKGKDKAKAVTLVTITNGSATAKFIDYGATLVSLTVPDKHGACEEVTLHGDTLDEMLGNDCFYGATVGRYGNRIKEGAFAIEGKVYAELACNNGPNHLHGGICGFDKRVWRMEPVVTDTEVGVRFSNVAEDGEEGYPGRLEYSVQYTLNALDDAATGTSTGNSSDGGKDGNANVCNELRMHYTASTDAPTHVNMTNHTYWNLSGNFKRNIYPTVLSMNCPHFLPVTDSAIPTGVIQPVKGTDMDFDTTGNGDGEGHYTLGKRIGNIDSGGGKRGYDHCYCIATGQARSLERAGEVCYIIDYYTLISFIISCLLLSCVVLCCVVECSRKAADRRGRPGTVCDGQRTGGRAHHDRFDNGARRAAVHSQLHTHRRRRRHGTASHAQRLLFGNAALPRQSQPERLPVHAVTAGRGLRDDNSTFVSNQINDD